MITALYRGSTRRLAAPSTSDAVAKIAPTAQEQATFRALLAVTTHTTPAAPNASDPWAYIRTPFAPGFGPSRWSDGSFGVLYSATNLTTALAEISYHLTRFLSENDAPPQSIPRTHLAFGVRGNLIDARLSTDTSLSATIYDPNDYRCAQSFGSQAHAVAQGIVAESVRNPNGGQCIAAFTPEIIRQPQIIERVTLTWNGSAFTELHHISVL